MAKLSYSQRKRLPASAFVFPKERKYPIHDEAHARNALARVAQHGTPAERAKVRAAVRRRYPGIEVGSDGKERRGRRKRKKQKRDMSRKARAIRRVVSA